MPLENDIAPIRKLASSKFKVMSSYFKVSTALENVLEKFTE